MRAVAVVRGGVGRAAAGLWNRKWVRRGVKAVGVLLCVLLVFRISLLVLLPTVIGRTARAFGVTCTYERMKLSVLGTNATLWGVSVRSPDGKEELLRAEYANANLSTMRLLGMKLLVWRLEADDVKVAVERRADGSIPLLDHLGAGSSAPAATPSQPSKPGTPKPADFDPPLELKALRLHGVTMKVKDESVSPVFEDTVRLDLRVSDIGRKGAPALVELDVGSDGLFSAARFEGEATAEGPTLDAAFRFSLRGLHADRVKPYLAAAGWTADDRNIDAGGRGLVSLRASKARPGVVEGAASLSEIAVRAASAPVAGLSKVNVEIAGLSPSEVHVSELLIEDGYVRAERGEDGRVRLAAFSAGAEGKAARPQVAPAAATPAPPTGGTGSAMRWRVDRVAGGKLVASLTDRAVSPVNTLAVEVAEFKATDLSNSGAADAAPAFEARLVAPGLVGDIRVSGRATPFVAQPRAVATVDIGQIRPEALTPYLRAMGIESTLDAASVRLAVTGSLDGGKAGLVLDRVVVEDGGASVVEVGPVTVSGVGIGAAGLKIGSIEGSGPVFAVRRLKDGRIEVPGLRLGGTPPPPSPTTASVDSPSAAGDKTGLPEPAGLILPAVRVGKVAWGAVKVRFEDVGLGEAPIELEDAGVAIENLVLGPGASEPGTLRVWARAPGMLERFEIVGALNSGENAVALEATAEGEGVSLARLAPYLKPLSIRPTLEGGRLTAHLSARLAGTERGMQVAFNAADASLRQGEQVWASASRVGVDRVDLEPGRIAIGQVQMVGGELMASRDAAGAISAAGISMLPGAGAAPVEATGPPPDPLAMLAALGDVSVEGVRVEGMNLRWSDEAAKRPVTISAMVDATVGALALNRSDAPGAPLDVRIAADGVAEQIQIGGTLRAGGDGVALETRVAGRGLTAGTVAAYLPAGVESALQDGTLDLAAAFTLGRAAAGGFSATASVRDVEYLEGEASLAHVGTFALEIDRLDPATGDVVVKRIAAEGIAAEATRRADGALSLLGLAITGAPPADPEPIEAPPAEQAADVAAIVQGSRAAPPLYAIEEIDIGIERVGFTDASRADAAPVALAGTRVRTTSPIRLLGPKPEENPPAGIEVIGRVEPLIGGFRVAAEAAPFATQPGFGVSVAATGIDGASITRVVPELAPLIDGTPLTDGRFRTEITGNAAIRRRAGGQIDLSRGVEMNVAVQGSEFRAGEAGPVLVGVGQIQAEQVKFEPATGNVVVRGVEVGEITGNAWRDESGTHVLGLIIKPLGTGVAEAEQAAGEAAPAATPEAVPSEPTAVDPPATTPAPATPSGPEVRIERLSVTGLDFKFEDRALTPPVMVPIDSLEAEFRGLSSKLMERDRPVRFNVSVGAGTVSLPKRARGGVLTGALSDLLGGVSESEAGPEMEDREFFSQLIAGGTMSFYPQPRGRATVSINGLELAAVRGLAQAAGASVGGGVFDGRVDLRARDDGAVAVRSRLVLTDLRYKEPPNGPVERYMSLPVPIDAAIGAVEAPDGSITLPVSVTLDQRGLTTGKLIGAIAGAAGQVVATAVASAPVKLVGGFAGLFVDTKGEVTWVDEDPIVLEYAAGVSALPPPEYVRLLEVISRARNTKRVQVSIDHQLGDADAALTARRANPGAADAAALAEDLRRRRAALVAARAELLAPASASAMGLAVDARAVDRLRHVQEELADLEDSMDRLYDLQRPGAEALADRRSRAAALALVDTRMGSVRQAVQRLGGSGVSRIAVGGAKIEGAGAERSRLVVRVRARK